LFPGNNATGRRPPGVAVDVGLMVGDGRVVAKVVGLAVAVGVGCEARVGDGVGVGVAVDVGTCACVAVGVGVGVRIPIMIGGRRWAARV
jgi:hypothetical protein